MLCVLLVGDVVFVELCRLVMYVHCNNCRASTYVICCFPAMFICRLGIDRYWTGTLLIWNLPTPHRCRHCRSNTGIRTMTLSLLAATWQV